MRIKKKLISILTIATALSTAAQVQNPGWSLPPSSYAFPLNNLTNLPTFIPSFYESASNMQLDAKGDVLFYIIDQGVFDKDGDYIGAFGDLDGDFGPVRTSEIAIVTDPNDCLRYYVILSGQRVHRYSNGSVKGVAYSEPYVGVVNFNMARPGNPSKTGAIESFDPILDLPSSPSNVYWEGNVGGIFMAASKLRSDNSRFVFLSNQDMGTICRYKIDNNGIVYDGDIPFTNTPTGGSWGMQGEMELIELPSGRYRIAVPYEYNTMHNSKLVTCVIYTAELDASGNVYSGNEETLYFYKSANSQNDPYIHGLEFSPDGSKLFITHNISQYHPQPFEYYDFSNPNTSDPNGNGIYSIDIGSLPGITEADFESSQIEIASDGKLYLGAEGRLAKLNDDPNNPNPATPSFNNSAINVAGYSKTNQGVEPDIPAHYYNESYTLPDQIDGMDYISSAPTAYNEVVYTALSSGVWEPGPSNNPWNINGDVFIEEKLIIPAGKNVTIKNMTFRFAPDAKVIVEQGAKLTIDGGTLTNSRSCNNEEFYWQGVQVYGTTSQNQLPSFNPTHQGMLVLKNGAVIEYAHKAATNWRQNSWNEIGGVIQSTNSVFRNNRRDVEFMAYKNYTPNNPNTEIANFSFFKNTSFISDDDFIENGLPQQAHVTLWQVHGIHFTNCHFSNNILSNKSTSGTPNRGIYAINASFKVGSGCSTMMNPCPSSDVLRSSFVGLERAVEITGASSSKAATITRTDFENNVWGVIVEDYDNVSIDRNHFELGNTGYGANTTGLGVGVITNNSTEFIIEENSVYTPNTNLPHRGIIVQNASSNDNRLYKNTLENLLIGTGAYGINHNSNYQNGLQFLCNSYVKNKTAISIGYNVTVDGVRFYQGDFSTKKSAGNTFSNNLLDIDNTANSIVYFHNWGNTEPMAYQGLVTLDTTSIANSCPTIFGGGIIFTPMVLASTLDSLKLVYNVKKDEYNNLHFNYLSLIDNGNTEYLQDQIETDWSDDAWFLRGKLIQESPYLSSDVLLTTAEQNVLPNGMLLEVLLANPDATRGGSFIAKLREVTNNSFPEYMIDYVKNNFDSRTLRTTLEGQMSSVHSELSSTRNYIKYLEKSADEFSYQERLKTVEMGSDLSHKVGLMDFYIENRQFALADSVLEDIYNDNKMKDEVEFIDNYDSYLLFRTGLGERNLAQLDSTEIDYLKDLAENKGRVAGYAQNILCFFYDICSDIKLLNGSAQTKSMNVSGESPTLNEVLYKINVYPNPTVEFTSLSWEIYDELQNAEFRVFDLQGQEVMFGTIEENKSEKALDVRSLDNGVYILAIFNNGEQKLNQKFVVNKPN